MAAGAGETTGRRTRGSSPETLRAQPREEPPVHAPPASPRRPEAPPPSGRGEGGGVVRGAVVPPAGPAAGLMSSRVFRVLGPSGCCLERRGGSSRRRAARRTPLRSTMQTRAPSPEWLLFLGRGCRTFTPHSKKVWNRMTELKEEVTRSPVLLPGFGQSRRCLGFLKLCPNFWSGSGGANRPHPVL